MAPPSGAYSLSSNTRTAIIVSGLAVIAGGALLYIHWRQRYGGMEKARKKGTGSESRALKKPQRKWKVILADNEPGRFVHLRRPGQDPNEPHPYGPEIRALIDDPAELLLAAAAAEPVKDLPSLSGVKYIWVEREDQLKELAGELMRVPEFGVDTEQHSQHSFLGYTALLQISTRSCDYVVDTLALHDSMHHLRPPFSDPRITKVFHGSDNDIVWLQRDFHIYPVNVFDTYRAAIALEKPQKSLAFLLQCYCGVGIDKRYQKSDWRLRPLPAELLEYARTDAHYLVYIADFLRAELLGGKAKEFVAGTTNERTTKTVRGSEGEEGAPIAKDEGKARELAAGSVSQSDARTARGSEDEDGTGTSDEEALSDVFADASRTSALSDSKPLGANPPNNSPLILGNTNQRTSDKPQAISLEPLAQVMRRCNALSLQLYEKEGSVSSSAASLISRHYSTPAGSQLAKQETPEERSRFRELVRSLCDWRDKIARKEDESLRAVLTDPALVAVALACPKTPAELLDAVRKGGGNKPPEHPFAERNPSPSLVLQRHVADVISITARFSASPAHLRKLEPSTGDSSGGVEAPRSDREIRPGAGVSQKNGGKSAREPSGWARVDDDSLSKKVHPARQYRDPAAARARFVSKFACKKTVYENCRIYAGDGRLLCYCDRKKLDWYVQKGLAEFCGDSPPSIKLRFEPKGRPEDENNEFYISSKSNRCVACGETSHYLRFRLVPSCYRQHFPEHLKSHRSHDIVLLCVDCHEVAHKATERHKKLVARKYGVPLIPAKVQGNGTEEAGSGTEGVDPDGLRRAATALIMHGSVMPKQRVDELERIVKDYYGKEEITPQDLMEARLIGMGPKGQRRVYKKKGTRFNGLPPETAEEVSGGDAGPEIDSGDRVGSQNEGGEMTEGLDAGRREADADDLSRGADDVSGGADVEAASEGESLSHVAEGRGGAAANRVGENRGRSVHANSSDRSESVSRQMKDRQSDRGVGEAIEVGSSESGATNGSTISNSDELVAEGEESGTDGMPTEGENGTDGTSTEPPDRAHSHSRRDSILSRRQRHRLRTELAWRENGRQAEAVLGHGQHGKRVVEILEETGGEDALREFVQEWRACFVEALRPHFLPPAWDVYHSGKREFGEFSVYKPKRGEDGEEIIA